MGYCYAREEDTHREIARACGSSSRSRNPPSLPPPPTGRGRRRCLAVRSQGERINSHWRERRARRRETPRHGSAGCRFRGDLPFARRTSARIFSPAGVWGRGGGRWVPGSWPQLCDRLSFVGPLSSGPKGWVEVAEVRSVQRCLRLCRPANLELSGHAWALPSVIVAPAECQAICSSHEPSDSDRPTPASTLEEHGSQVAWHVNKKRLLGLAWYIQ